MEENEAGHRDEMIAAYELGFFYMDEHHPDDLYEDVGNPPPPGQINDEVLENNVRPIPTLQLNAYGRRKVLIGDLCYWTTDAQLESELCKYGRVKELKFIVRRYNGKSKGWCVAEFDDPAAAAACKEGMNGHVFNGRPCVVMYYSSEPVVTRVDEGQVNRGQQQRAQRAVNQPQSCDGQVNRGQQQRAQMAVIRPQSGDGQVNRGQQQRGQRAVNRPQNGDGGGGNSQGGMEHRRRDTMDVSGSYVVPPWLGHQTMMGRGNYPVHGGGMGRGIGGYGSFPGPAMVPYPGVFSSYRPVGGVVVDYPAHRPLWRGGGMVPGAPNVRGGGGRSRSRSRRCE